MVVSVNENTKISNELFFSKQTSKYSGFFYFVYNATKQEYKVYINAFGPNNNLVARSDTVDFSSLAGDIEIPLIDSLNAMPAISAYSTKSEYSLNDTIYLKASAADFYGGKIIKWEWDAGNSGNFTNTTPDSNFVAVAPLKPDSSYKCILRVMDDDSNVVADTVKVKIISDVPVLHEQVKEVEVSLRDSIHLRGTTVQQFGKIIKWEWDAGNSGNFINTTPDSNFVAVAPPTPDSSYKCILRAMDDDSNVVTDTVNIKVIKDRPNLHIKLKEMLVSLGDTIHLAGTVAQKYGNIIKWEWDIGNSGSFKETTPDSNFIAIAPMLPENNYKCILRATDDDSNVVTDTIIISIKETIKDYDGNRYSIVKIGNQSWIGENLRTTKLNDGTVISLVEDSAAWKSSNIPAYCFLENTTNADNIRKFGALYNWFAVDTKKLAPEGWHVPTDSDWTELQDYLIANGYGATSNSTNSIGNALSSWVDWTDSTVQSDSNDQKRNDSFGFTALPSGSRNKSGTFFGSEKWCTWWSSSYRDYNVMKGIPVMSLYFHESSMPGFEESKNAGYSIRLIKNR